MFKVFITALTVLCFSSGSWALPQDGLHPESDGWANLFNEDLMKVNFFLMLRKNQVL